MAEEKERFTSYLLKDTITRLRDLSEETGVPQSRIVENGLREYLDKIEQDISILFQKK